MIFNKGDIIKTGIIGFGGMGEYHSRMIKDFKLFENAGIFDIDETRCRLANSCGIKAFKSVDELLKVCDLVIVATPNDSHLQYVLSAAAAKVNILCEKPAAMDPDEFKLMQNAAEKENVLLCVHQNRRYDADYLTMKEVVQSGVLGRVYRIESRVKAANGIPGDWRKEKKRGGGMMLDWGVHLLDQALQIKAFNEHDCVCSYVLGSEVEDGFCMRLLSSDFEYLIEVDTNTFIPQDRWRIYGTNGTCVINDWDLHGETVRVNENENIVKGITAGNGFTKTMSARSGLSVEKLSLPKLHFESLPFYRMLYASLCGEANAIKNDEVFKVLNLMQIAMQSAKKISLN